MDGSPANTVLTGASGHIGYHVALQLIQQGYQVTCLIRNENKNTAHLKTLGAIIHIVDLLKPETYQQRLQGAACLFHLASENTTDVADEERTLQNTYTITQQVLTTAISCGVKTIIYTSSVVVLGRSDDKYHLITEDDIISNPNIPYIKGKLYAERYVDDLIQNKQVDIRRLYPSWVIGHGNVKITPPQRTINDYLAKGQKVYFDGGISVASVQHVAKAHISAWTKGQVNGKYVLGGQNLTFKQFYTLLATHSGHKKPFVFLPKWFIYLVSLFGKMIFGLKFKVQPSYVKEIIGKYSWYDSSKAVTELGYDIPPAGETIKLAISEAPMDRLKLNDLYPKNNPTLKRIAYADDDVLLITGFPGWLGDRMVDILMNGDRWGQFATDRRIRLLVQPHLKDVAINLPANFEIVYGDLADKASLTSALAGVKAVYHLAGVIYPPKIKTFYEVNFQGTKNLVDACIELGVRRILFMGTDSICGYGRGKRIFSDDEPAHPYKNYGQSKYLAEKYILDKTTAGSIDGTSLRGFWFFGPFMPERNLNFFKMFRWPRQIVFGNGKNLRSISHTDNTVQAFIKAEKNIATYNKWYWIGGSKADNTVDDIYTEICDALNVKYKSLYIPIIFCELFNWADTVLGWFGILNPTIHAAGKFHKDIAGKVDAARQDFGYDPTIGFEQIKEEIQQVLKQ